MLASKSTVLRRRPFFGLDAGLLSRGTSLVALAADPLSPGAGLSSVRAGFVRLGAGLLSLGAGLLSLGTGLLSLGAGLEPRSTTAIGVAGSPAAAASGASVEARLPVRLRLIVRS
jgi:hypothetical protein